MRALVIASPDAFANGIKPVKIKDFLIKRGYEVTMYPTKSVTRMGDSGVRAHLPGLRPAQLRIFILGAVYELCKRMPQPCRNLIPYLMSAIIRYRGKYLSQKLAGQHFDLMICESSFDEGIFLYDRVARIQILDLPAPFAEELYFGADFSRAGLNFLNRLEKRIYKRADYLSFHWHTYAEYVREYKYDGDNFVDINYGTEAKTLKAEYSDTPRIIFMGYLKGYWVNLPLLAELCRLVPNLDVYGGPKPPSYLGINYKGYAPSKDVMAQYQFGLITISDDPLRKQSFSSKQLEYMSYGLPVLAPAWRKDPLMDDSTIYFNDAHDLLCQLESYRSREMWQKKSMQAIADAKKLTWDRALAALGEILDKENSR